jgi:porin
VIANLSQYLLVLDDAQQIDAELKSGQALRGVGVFARGGWGPEQSNPVTGHVSAALFAQGLVESRKYDSFGVGYYRNFISADLKNSVSQLTDGTSLIRDEQGVEVFYSYAVTPAIRLITSYQHIWNPFAAQVAANEKAADLLLARLTIAW